MRSAGAYSGTIGASRNKTKTYLHDHHVAVEGTLRAGLEWPVDAATDMRDDGATDGHVGNEVAVHDVNMEPVGTLLHLRGAIMTEVGEVGAENGRGNDGRRRHDERIDEDDGRRTKE
jgi:hypothetical protein